MFYCDFYSVDVAVAFLNHFLTVGRHGSGGGRCSAYEAGTVPGGVC
jgi:hypothetical protein